MWLALMPCRPKGLGAASTLSLCPDLPPPAGHTQRHRFLRSGSAPLTLHNAGHRSPPPTPSARPGPGAAAITKAPQAVTHCGDKGGEGPPPALVRWSGFPGRGGPALFLAPMHHIWRAFLCSLPTPTRPGNPSPASPRCPAPEQRQGSAQAASGPCRRPSTGLGVGVLRLSCHGDLLLPPLRDPCCGAAPLAR